MLLRHVILCVLYSFFFFFSSRRRHTRLQGDWSSDVCSSDLRSAAPSRDAVASPSDHGPFAHLKSFGSRPWFLTPQIAGRSEERRVGKECRSRWSPYH